MQWHRAVSIVSAASLGTASRLEASCSVARIARPMSPAMRARQLHDIEGKRTFAVVLSVGDEAMACLKRFAASYNIGGAQITAIGALSAAELAFFDWETKKYLPINIDEQVEVASLIGDIARDPDGAAAVHVHAVLSDRTGAARAGHLTKGYVRPTLEVIVTETPIHLQKTHDPESGLALIELAQSAS